MYFKFHEEDGIIRPEFILTDLSNSRNQEELNLDKYKILWARNFDIMVIVDGYHINLEKNHVLFCTPLHIVTVEKPFSDLIVYCFNSAFYCIKDHDKEVGCNGLLFLGSSVPPIIKLDKSTSRGFELLLMMFEEEFTQKDHIQGEMLRVLLKRLLITSVRIFREKMPYSAFFDTKVNIIREFNLLVEKHFRTVREVKSYAEMLNISPKSLSNILSKNNYKTPSSIINKRVVLEADKLLRMSQLNIYEIASKLGFHEASHFSKFIKTQTGLSPSQIRAKTFEKSTNK